jgi:hypothetical protein
VRPFSIRGKTGAEYRTWLREAREFARGLGEPADAARLLQAIDKLEGTGGERRQVMIDLIVTIAAIYKDEAFYDEMQKANKDPT